MLKGTTVAIRLGWSLRAEALRQGCPADLVSDLQSAIDALIVHALQSPDNQTNRDQVQHLCTIVAEVFSVMMSTRGYSLALAEGAANNEAE